MIFKTMRMIVGVVGLGAVAAVAMSAAAVADGMVKGGGKGGSIKDAPVAAERPAFSWRGLYVGATVGYGWGESRMHDGVPSNPFDTDGFLFGGTIGYNFPLTAHVLAGIEADYSWSNVKGQFGPGNLGQPDGSSWGCISGPCRADIRSFGTLRGRLGLTRDNLFVYGTGGLAWGNVSGGIDNDSSFQASDTNVGWAAGLGAELAINHKTTLKLEWLHVDLGYTKLANDFFKVDAKMDVIRAGINIKLGN